MNKSFQLQQLQQILFEENSQLSTIKPSDWAEKHRYMTSDVSAFPGPFSYDRTPYLREVVDCLSPDHPAREIAVKKSSQIGYSTGVIENGIGWIISEQPSNILLAARDESLVKEMVNKKIDQMINSCGLRDLIRPNNQRKNKQRTGDTDMSKEFVGGNLTAFSIQKPGRSRQFSVKYGFMDDFEAAPVDPSAGGADPLFRSRFRSFGDSKKIFWISTPEMAHSSNIQPLYLRGDQRMYYVPCPCCGDYIVLEWRTKTKEGKHAGITWELDGDKDLIQESVGYTCQSCGGFFTDGHKYEMNLAGEWRPTVKQVDPTFYSYYINSLYAPVGMDDWTSYVKDYLACCPPGGKIKTDAYKVFINTVLGEVWEETGTKINVNRLSRNDRTYAVGTVPNELSVEDGNGPVVMVTCAVDLNGKEEDARLDYEIIAWSSEGKSYSVDHGSIGTHIPRENTLKKKVDRERWSYIPYQKNNVWDVFEKVLTKTYADQNGDEYKIAITGIDTGTHTQYAYDFITKCLHLGINVVGLKGTKENDFRKIDANTRCYSKSKERSDLYLVDVNQVKDDLSGKVNLKWSVDDGSLQPNGFMNFPTPSDGKYTMKSYFSHYQAESKVLKRNVGGRTVGYIWTKRNSNDINTFWDCRVYNEAVKEILMDLVCKEAGIKTPSWNAYTKIVLG